MPSLRLQALVEEREYSILLVMSELSTVRCDRALGLLDCRYTGVECRRGAVVEVLWPIDRAVDSGEGQPGPELGPGGSCGVHSWIEGASGEKGGFLGLHHKTKEADGG